MAAPQRSTEQTRSTQKPARAAPAPARTAALAQPNTADIVSRAQADANSIAPGEVLHLQRTVGNRAVGGLLSRSASTSTRPSTTSSPVAIQPKLTVGAANDSYEQEADRVAAEVLSAPVAASASAATNPGPPSGSPPGGSVRKPDDSDRAQRLPLASAITPLARGGAPIGFTNKLHRSAVNLAGSFDAGEAVESRIAANSGGGSPLPDPLRSSLEPRFGADFSGVRLHSGGESSSLNRQLGARAFTHSNHIYLGEGASAGDHKLLAHELTHVVQQGAAHAARRKLTTPAMPLAMATPGLQRWPWSKKKKPEAPSKPEATPKPEGGPESVAEPAPVAGPVPDAGPKPEVSPEPAPVMGAPRVQQRSQDPAADQASAFKRVEKAYSDVVALTQQAKTEGETLKEESAPDEDVLQFRKSKSSSTKKAVKRLHRAEAAVHGSVDDTRGGLVSARRSIQQLEDDIVVNGKQIAIKLAKDPPDTAEAGAFALDSLSKAASAESKAAAAKQQVDSMKETSDLAGAMARGKMSGKTWGAAEASASDAAVQLEHTQHKMTRYYQYIEMDLKTIEAHIAAKSLAVTAAFSAEVTARVIASGRARGSSLTSKSGPLSDAQAQKLIDMDEEEDTEEATEEGTGFGLEAEQSMPQQPSPQALTKGNKYLDPSLREGAGAGFKKMLSSAGSSVASGIGGGLKSAGKLLSTPFRAIHRAVTRRGGKAADIAKLRQVQGLELMAKFAAMDEQRQANGDRWMTEAMQWHDAALQTYDQIDAGKRKVDKDGDTTPPDTAILQAGALWTNVARAATNRATMKKYRSEIAEDSSKYEKFGARAIGTGGKIKFALGGMLGGGLKFLTGGLVRYESVDKGAGYGAALEKRTIVDDVKKAIILVRESSQLRGLGGAGGARAFAVLQGIAAFLGIAKTVAGTLALFFLWAPPVSVGFAAAGLYAAIVKMAIDLVLMIWAGIGSKMSMDPRARTRNRGNFARHGIAFGEGAATVGGAGLVAGLSDNPGNFVGHKAGFDTHHAGAGSKEKGHSSVWNWSVTMDGDQLYYSRIAAKKGLSKSVPLVEGLATTIGTGVSAQNVRALKMHDEARDLKVQSKDAKDKMSKGSKKLLDMVTKAEAALAKKNAGKKPEPGDLEVQQALPGVGTSVSKVDAEAQKLPETPEG